LTKAVLFSSSRAGRPASSGEGRAAPLTCVDGQV